MSGIDLILTVYDNFHQSRGRFLLTLSGIMIGVALLVILASFLKGAEKTLLKAQQEALDANLITALPAQLTRKERQKTSRPLEDADAHAAQDSVLFQNTSIGYERRKITRVSYLGKTRDISLSGISFEGPALYKLELATGRFFLESDFVACRRVCILGNEVWSKLDNPKYPLMGSWVSIEDNLFRVVGILKSKMFMGKTSSVDLWDRRIIIPVSTFKIDIRPSRSVDLLFVRLHSFSQLNEHIPLLKESLKNLFLRRHYGIENFTLRDPNEEDTLSILMSNVIMVLFSGIASLAILVGGINIMNIMLITVTERTREIGVRRAVGCTRLTLVKQFLLESGLISLIGGIFGILLGIGFSALLSFILENLWGSWFFVIDPQSIIIGALVAFFTGIFFGLYPAYQASRLTPEQCLRYE